MAMTSHSDVHVQVNVYLNLPIIKSMVQIYKILLRIIVMIGISPSAFFSFMLGPPGLGLY